MKILFVSPRLPYPPSRGDTIRSFNIVRHLSEKHSVVVASLARTEQEVTDSTDLRKYCDEVIADVLPDRNRWLQAITALSGRMPSSAAFFWSPRLFTKIQDCMARTRFDAIVVHCAFVAQYVSNCQSAFKILDFCDLDSGKWREYAAARPFPLSAGYALESTKLRKYELAMSRRFDWCTVATQGELEELEKIGISTPCTVVPNGVDVSYFARSRDAVPGLASVVAFVGRMDYFPNIDGVCYFVEQVLPLIREQLPEVKFRIIGSNPSRRVRELAKVPGVTVTGHVPDVRTWLKDAAVSVAPLRIARGTQNKILEAMAMGLPVVSTPEAAKGIQATPQHHFSVAATPKRFAEQVLELLRTPQLREGLSESARRQIERAHLWPACMEIFDTCLTEAGSSLHQEVLA